LREPDPFVDSFTALVSARALSSAAMLGVFDALHEAPASAEELAQRLGLDALGADTLLTALSTLGYVEADGERFRNTDVSERLLVRDSPDSIATFVGDQGDLHWQVLDLLPDTLRTGRPYAMHEQRRDDSERWEAYIRGLFEISRAEHAANAALVPVDEPRAQVDVAGGHGAFSMAMCDRHPELHATVLDLPPSAAVGRRIVAEQGYADRISFREGDVFEVGLGDADSLDVVSVFNLAHHLPEERNQELCWMARVALRPGGCLVIGDSARPEPGEPVSEHGAISSLLFYAWSHSRNFTPSEIRRWMEAAGFVGVETHRNERSPWRVVVVGR
jgi:SAM-dependent methyltransferase